MAFTFDLNYIPSISPNYTPTIYRISPRLIDTDVAEGSVADYVHKYSVAMFWYTNVNGLSTPDSTLSSPRYYSLTLEEDYDGTLYWRDNGQQSGTGGSYLPGGSKTPTSSVDRFKEWMRGVATLSVWGSMPTILERPCVYGTQTIDLPDVDATTIQRMKTALNATSYDSLFCVICFYVDRIKISSQLSMNRYYDFDCNMHLINDWVGDVYTSLSPVVYSDSTHPSQLARTDQVLEGISSPWLLASTCQVNLNANYDYSHFRVYLVNDDRSWHTYSGIGMSSFAAQAQLVDSYPLHFEFVYDPNINTISSEVAELIYQNGHIRKTKDITSIRWVKYKAPFEIDARTTLEFNTDWEAFLNCLWSGNNTQVSGVWCVTDSQGSRAYINNLTVTLEAKITVPLGDDPEHLVRTRSIISQQGGQSGDIEGIYRHIKNLKITEQNLKTWFSWSSSDEETYGPFNTGWVSWRYVFTDTFTTTNTQWFPADWRGTPKFSWNKTSFEFNIPIVFETDWNSSFTTPLFINDEPIDEYIRRIKQGG